MIARVIESTGRRFGHGRREQWSRLLRQVWRSPLWYSLLIVLGFFVSRWVLVGAYFRKDLVINTGALENLYGLVQRAGQSPLWAPELAGGYPLLATGQLGFWYPLHMVLRQFFSGAVTLNVSLLLHALLAAAGTFALLRHYKVTSVAAGAAAVLWPLGAVFVGKYESLNLVLPFMWVPWMLLCLQLFLERGRLIYLVIWIGAAALAILVGHPQMAVYVLILQALAVLCLIGRQWRRWPRALLVLGGSVLVLGLTSFYYLPILANVPDTDRATGTLKPNAAGMFDNQFTPAAFLGVVIPHPFGHHDTYHGPTNENELSSYFGPVALLLSVAGLVTGRRRFPTLWWLAIVFIAVGLLLAVGGYSPVFRWLVDHGWTYFNAPARFYFYTHIGLVFLLAAGIDALWRARAFAMRGSGVARGVLLVSVLGPALWVSWTWHEGVPWRFTREPAAATILRSEPGLVRVAAVQQLSDPAPDNNFEIRVWNSICTGCLYRQTLVAPFATLDGIALKMSKPMSDAGTVRLRLFTSEGDVVRESSVSAGDIVDSEWAVFTFAPLEDVADTELYFEVTSDLAREQAPRLLIHMNPGAQYDPSGALYNCSPGECTPVVQADAAFTVVVHSAAVDYYEALAPYVAAGFGLGSVQWSGSLPLQTVKDYNKPLGTWGDSFEPAARRMIDRFATTHLISFFPPHRYATDVDGVSLVASVPVGDRFLRLYRNNQAFPRVHFAAKVAAVRDSIDQVTVLRQFEAEDRTSVVADVGEDMVFDVTDARAHITHDERTQVRVETEQRSDELLVLRDVLLTGWVATVDGQPVPLHRVDGIFRGVFVPAGQHVVEFQYRPSWLRVAVWLVVISSGGLAVLLWYAVVSARQDRRDGRAVF